MSSTPTNNLSKSTNNLPPAPNGSRLSKIKNAMKAAQNPNFVAAGVHQNPNVVKDPTELAKIAKAMGQ